MIHTAQQGHRRQASSIYSQVSHAPTPKQYQSGRQPAYASSNFQNQVNTYNDDHIEISPPSSPDIGAEDRLPQDAPSTNYDARRGLPQSRTQAGLNQQSRLPVPGKKTVIERRPVSRNVSGAQLEAATSLAGANEDKRSNAGLLGKTTPIVTNLDEPERSTPIVTNLEATFGAPYAKQPKESLGDRMRKMRGVKPEKKLPPTQQRPEWKGGSGRMAIVPPPQDNPSAPPLAIPRKSSKRVPSMPSLNNSRSNTPKAGTPVADSPLRNNADASGYFPPRTASTPRGDSLLDKQPAIHDPYYEDRFADLSFDTHPTQRNRSVTQPGGMKPPAVALEITPTGSVRPSTSNHSNYNQYPNEVSRFSVTTYATSANGSPRTSLDADAPPVPEIPQESLLNRRRPVGTSYTKPTKADRPPPVTGTPKVVAMHERTPSLSKALPASPEAIAASDRVTALEAQLADLERQHNNILKSITQMTKLNPDTMTGLRPGLGEEARRLEMRRREEEKKKVAGLREELERVKGEEHELGLKLHRARKKRDERCEWESSGLWVRRVTG